MKRMILFLALSFAFCNISFGQTEVKVKSTSTVPQKVHNTFSKNKRHNGYVTKTKGPHHKRKHKHTATKDIIKKD